LPTPRAPLFRDPIHDGAADPTIVWNRAERAWWLVYTARRANVDCPGVAYCHGSDIGIASTSDGGSSWRYRGTMRGLEWEPGRNTFWAPEILWHDGIYHMYVSYVPGVPHEWTGARHILHMTSPNLWDWGLQSRLELSSDRVIDACVHPMPGGGWRLWYKDEAHGSHIYAADSPDLVHWTVAGAVLTDRGQEGPNVFHWGDAYWLVTDPWKGLGVYRSADAQRWTPCPRILENPGTRRDDQAQARHADVLVQGDAAYIFYFTHPQEREKIPETVPGVIPYPQRRTSLQVARLELLGEGLACDRDAEFDLRLREPD